MHQAINAPWQLVWARRATMHLYLLLQAKCVRYKPLSSSSAAAAAAATSGGTFGDDVASATASAVSSVFGKNASAAAPAVARRVLAQELVLA